MNDNIHIYMNTYKYFIHINSDILFYSTYWDFLTWDQ